MANTRLSRLAQKAKIKRATASAQRNTTLVDGRALDQIEAIYAASLREIDDILNQNADSSGALRLDVLRKTRGEVAQVLDELRRLQKSALFERMAEVSALGVEPFAEQVGAQRVADMVRGSVKAAADFQSVDGLRLSDRLWRSDKHSRDVVQSAIQSAIIQGKSASEAAQDFLTRGQPVPDDLQRQIDGAKPGALSRVLGEQLMTGQGSPYRNALRLFRTEINRAHIIAYRQSAFEHPDVVGTKFVLSPNHPEYDICDMYAKANLYGLGPGVYPQGKSPLPAHPNTLSYEVVVFADEVTDADREGRQSAEEWLKGQPVSIQTGVLGGTKKHQAFRAGVLSPKEYRTPWRIIEKRLRNKGIDVDLGIDFGVATLPMDATDIGNPFTVQGRLQEMSKTQLLEKLASFSVAGVKYPGATTRALQSIAGGLDKVLGRFGARVGQLGWLSASNAQSANGMYSYFPAKLHLDGYDKLELNKGYALEKYKQMPARHLAYLERRTQMINYWEAQLARADEGNRIHIENNLVRIRNASRWSYSSGAADPVFATAAHEAGHVLYFQGIDIPHRFSSALETRGVTQNDWFKVSEYAGSSVEELFAEVTAYFASDEDSLLPEEIRQAYIESLQNYQRLR